MSDPFSILYSELWGMCDKHPVLSRHVKTGNRIRFDNDELRQPMKTSIAASDLPELMLDSIGLSVNLAQSSCSTSVVKRFRWILSTGDRRVTEFLYPLEFALVSAFANIHKPLYQLQWQGKTFITNVQPGELTEGMSVPQQNRNINGWSLIWPFDITMSFATKEIATFQLG